MYDGPGIFGPVSVKPHVHVAGSGEGVTTLRTFNGFTTTVTMQSNSSLRDLTVEHGFPVSFNISRGLSMSGASGVEVTHVTVSTVGGTGPHEAVRVLGGSSARFHDLTVLATGASGEDAHGIVIEDSTNEAAVLSDLKVRVENPFGDDPDGINTGVRVSSGASASIRRLEAEVAGGHGSAQNIGLLVSGIAFVDLRDSRLAVSGSGEENLGMLVSDSSASIHRSSLAAADGGIGLMGEYRGSRTNMDIDIRDSRITGTGGGAQGIVLAAPSLVSRPLVAVAHHTTVEGPDATVSVQGDWKARLAHSHLVGAAAFEGADADLLCRFTTDQNLTTYATTCP